MPHINALIITRMHEMPVIMISVYTRGDSHREDKYLAQGHMASKRRTELCPRQCGFKPWAQNRCLSQHRRWSCENLGKLFIFLSLSSFQPLSHARLPATSWTAARQASLSTTNSRTLLELTSIELVTPSNYNCLITWGQ